MYCVQRSPQGRIETLGTFFIFVDEIYFSANCLHVFFRRHLFPHFDFIFNLTRPFLLIFDLCSHLTLCLVCLLINPALGTAKIVVIMERLSLFRGHFFYKNINVKWEPKPIFVVSKWSLFGNGHLQGLNIIHIIS